MITAACPVCGRTLRLDALGPGDRIWCGCGRWLIVVREPGRLRVAVMLRPSERWAL